MPDDNRMVLVAVAPAWVIRGVEIENGPQIRKNGTLWMGDELKDTEIELQGEGVTITVSVKTKGKR